MAFSSSWQEELLSKSDIADIISGYIELKPKGRRLWGLCPFHGEKTPSFSVSPDKQLYYCFGCHASGSVIQFIMNIEKLSYREAILFLADRAHMTLPDQVSDENYLKQKAYKERLAKLNQTAARFFCEQLLGNRGEAAREYAQKRGLSKEIIIRFGIGYAPESWDSLKKHLLAAGYSEKEMIDAGVLVHNSDKNSSYDTYRNRLIFPIQSVTGTVIGFGGRVLDDSKPKYINTGDTPIYNKKNNLYGLNLLKQEKINDIIIVEGYMDVVGLYKAGIRNAVASLGTALTVQQARLLKRYANEIYIAYDGDFAGQNGMIRGLEILSEQGLSVHIIVFPDNLDPDEYVQKYGKDNFYELKSKAFTISRFKLERMADGVDFSIEDQREKYALNACKYISSLQPLVHDRYLKIVSEKSGYPIASLLRQVSNRTNGIIKNDPVKPTYVREEAESGKEADRDQRMILQACVQDYSAVELVDPSIFDLVFKDDDFREFFLCIKDRAMTPAAYIAQLQEEKVRKLSSVLQSDFDFPNPKQIVSDCINNIYNISIEQQITELQTQLASGNCEDETKLILKITELQKKKRGNKKNGKNGR